MAGTKTRIEFLEHKERTETQEADAPPALERFHHRAGVDGCQSADSAVNGRDPCRPAANPGHNAADEMGLISSCSCGPSFVKLYLATLRLDPWQSTKRSFQRSAFSSQQERQYENCHLEVLEFRPLDIRASSFPHVLCGEIEHRRFRTVCTLSRSEGRV